MPKRISIRKYKDNPDYWEVVVPGKKNRRFMSKRDAMEYKNANVRVKAKRRARMMKK